MRKKSYSQAESNYRSAKKAKKQAYKNSTEYKTKRSNTLKTAAKVGAAVLGTALAAYGGYKAATLVSSKSRSVAAGKRIMATYQKGRDVKSSLKSMERYYLRAEGRAAAEEATVRKTMNKADWLQNNSQKKDTINKLTNAQVAAGRKADKYYHYRAR